MKTHYRHIRHGDREADDEKLAPLILELWRAGIDTIRSCQRHTVTRKLWITFAETVGAEKFLNIVCSNRDARRQRCARRESWYFGQYDSDSGPPAGCVVSAECCGMGSSTRGTRPRRAR